MDSNKIYLIQWGFYSSNESTQELEAICSSYEKAVSMIEKKYERKGLYRRKDKQTDLPLNVWTDDDFWVSIQEAYIDSECYHMSQEEWEKL